MDGWTDSRTDIVMIIVQTQRLVQITLAQMTVRVSFSKNINMVYEEINPGIGVYFPHIPVATS